MIFLESSDKENIFAFTRTSDEDKIFAMFNLSGQRQQFEITGETLQGSYKNYFTNETELFGNTGTLSLNPWEYRIYTK